MTNDPFMDSVHQRIKERKKMFKQLAKGTAFGFHNPVMRKKALPKLLCMLPKGKSIGRKMVREEAKCRNHRAGENVTGLTLGRR